MGRKAVIVLDVRAVCSIVENEPRYWARWNLISKPAVSFRRDASVHAEIFSYYLFGNNVRDWALQKLTFQFLGDIVRYPNVIDKQPTFISVKLTSDFSIFTTEQKESIVRKEQARSPLVTVATCQHRKCLARAAL